MLPNIEFDVILLAIEKKNGNANNAALMLFDEAEVSRLKE